MVDKLNPLIFYIMEHNKIFNRFFNAAAVRAVDFSALNMDQKLQALSDMGLKIDMEKDYKVNKTIRRDSYDSAALFASAVLPLVQNNAAKTAAVIEVLQHDNTAAAVDVTAVIKGRNLSKSQTIDVLSRDIKTDAGKIEIENFGGENFVAWCKWLRELSEDEFNALQSK